jgi:hypothetical protein
MVTAMLMIECPNCKEWIHSPLLLEIKETKCPSCEEVVPVTEVYISAGSYSIYREALLKSRPKYIRLLEEAEKELNELKNKKSMPYDKSADTVISFIEDLKEMLDGSRGSPRTPGGSTTVEYSVQEVTHQCGLVNISSSGICIDVGEVSTLPQKGEKICVQFLGEEPFRIEGMVMWAGKETQLGIRFLDMDESTIKHLHNYILGKIPELRIEKKKP